MCGCIFKGNFVNDTDKMQGETFETPIFTMKFLQNLLDQLAIITFTPGKPGSPFSPYIGKKVKCKVYNIGYSQQHVLIHVKF